MECPYTAYTFLPRSTPAIISRVFVFCFFEKGIELEAKIFWYVALIDYCVEYEDIFMFSISTV
jgi:hypothetical protein